MKPIYSLILLFLFFTPLFAQDSLEIIEPDLKHGVEFQIGSLLTLTSYGGYTFAYRYVYKENAGLRLGITTNINTEEYKLTQSADTVTIYPPNHNNSYNFKIVAQYLKVVRKLGNFSLIVGGGPFIGFYRNDDYTEKLGAATYLQKYSDTESGFSFGFDVVGGIEYKLFSNVFITAEYGLSLERSVSDIDTETTEVFQNLTRTIKNSGTKSSFGINSLGTKLGIAVFF